LAVGAALVASSAPAASADATHPLVWLNEQSGELSFTGTAINDVARVSKSWSSKAGAYVIDVRSYGSAAADFSARRPTSPPIAVSWARTTSTGS
jgi:hypothetical protein